MSKIEIHIDKPSIMWQNLCDIFRYPKFLLKRDFWKLYEKHNGIIFIDLKFFSIYIFPGW